MKMNDVNLNLYRIFYVTAQSKSILEASEKLYVSQPAISKSIKNLEENMGANLLIRNKKGLELTEYGKIIYECVEKCYNQLIYGQKLLEELKKIELGTVSIGAPSHIARFFVIDLVKKFKKKYPNIKFDLISASTSNLIEKLYSHKLDIIIDSPPIEVNDANVEKLKIDDFEMIFIAPPNFDYKSFDISEKKKYNFILPSQNSTNFNLLRKELCNNGITIEANIIANTTEVIIDLVKQDLGIGYVAKKAVEHELLEKKLIEIPISFELPKLELNLVYMKNYLTSASKKFIDSLYEF